MPWDSVSEAEKSVPGIKNLSVKGKRAWLSAFNACYKDKGDSESCYAIAYAAAKKASKKGCILCSDDEDDEEMDASGAPVWADEDEVAAELLAVARELMAGEIQADMSFQKEARAYKLRAMVSEFFSATKRFKGTLNQFLQDIQNAVDDPSALRQFPELADIAKLSGFMSASVIKHVMMPENELLGRMKEVVEADA